MNYVYTYTVGTKVVYVGIGTEDGKFSRAKDIAGHKFIKAEAYENIEISIVARNLKRRVARLIEAILIGQHRDTVLNRTVAAKLPQFCDLKIQKSGKIIERQKSEEEEFWLEYKSIEGSEGEGFDQDETLRYLISMHGFVPRKLKGQYDVQAIREETEAAIKASQYDTQNLQHGAPIPVDDPSLDADQRITDYLNYYAYGAYKIERVVHLALSKSVKGFCSYMWHYFVRLQLNSKRTPKDEKLKAWFLGKRDKRPKFGPVLPSQFWRFERLYHFILLNERGFVGK